MAILTGIYGKLAGLALLLALLGGAYLYAHHQGAVSQQQADAAKLTTAANALSAASSQLRINAATFAAINANAAREAVAAKVEQAKASTAVALSQQAAKQAAIDAAAWQLKFNRAAVSKPCATVLQQLVCAAVFRP